MRIPSTLLATLLLLLAAGGCNDMARVEEPPTDDLEVVEPPPDLAQLDLAVRDQFDSIRSRVREIEVHDGADPDEAGAAWGALGQWFDVYGYDESARRCYRNAQRLQPEEPRWPYYLGALDEAAGALDAAQSRYLRALELAPDVAAPKVKLGDVALRRQELDDAERFYRQVLGADPSDPGALLGVARVELARDDPRAALETLEPLAGDQPEAVQVMYTLSLAWRSLGDDGRAEEYLRRVPEDNLDQIPLDLGSDWDRELMLLDVGARTLTRKGARAFHRGKHDRAAVLLGRAVEADPEGPEKRINYAVALHEIGRSGAAEEELLAALDRAEAGTELAAKAHLELARLLVDTGRRAAAVPHLEASLAVDPRSVPAHLLFGRLLQRQGRLEEALGHYAAVRELEEEVTGVRFWHAALLLALDRRQAAFDALTEDVLAAHDPRGPRLLLARLLSTSPDADPAGLARARGLLTGSGGSGPVDVLFAETAAMVAAAESRFEEARAWESAAVERLAQVRARSGAHTARRRLVLYERGEPCRAPWEDGERLVTAAVAVPTVQSFLDQRGSVESAPSP